MEPAAAILGVLDAGWCHGTPASEPSRCLGMAISDTGNQAAIPAVEARIRALFPARLGAPRPLLPAFQCCGSDVIPAFNNHPDTTLDDIHLVVTAAAGQLYHACNG